jgi:death-on-curing protein
VKSLSTVELLYLHDAIIEQTGGLHGVRDASLLESIFGRPNRGFGDVVAFADLFQKIASVMEGIIKFHPFTDGNVRTGVAAAYLLLESNAFRLMASDEGLESVALRIAEGAMDASELAGWLRATSEAA